MYIRTLHTHPVLILVTRPSCVNLANLIKFVGDSCSYLCCRRSHYARLKLQASISNGAATVRLLIGCLCKQRTVAGNAYVNTKQSGMGD